MVCPLCKLGDDSYGIAVHLQEGHGWSYENVMDWLRDHEELKTQRSA